MKLYKIKSGILIENTGNYYYMENENWDVFFNDDDLLQKMRKITLNKETFANGPALLSKEIMAPLANQEIWASGVTYYNSKLGRQEESKNTGGGHFYAHVYDAERPELFFKATAARTVGHGQHVRIRKDSTWNVPEPELTLAITSSGKIVGFTIGNDMSSRSIEGENPLYLPQAKTYDGCAALGPCVFVSEKPLDQNTGIRMEVLRTKQTVFHGETSLAQMKRTPEELVSFLYRETSFPYGCFLMTGTGIVPGPEFSLAHGDMIRISVDPIGTLVNIVQ